MRKILHTVHCRACAIWMEELGPHLLSLSEVSQVCAPGCGVPNICDGMGHSNEYAEFERRTIIGYRHCNSFFSPTYSTVNCKMCFCKV